MLKGKSVNRQLMAAAISRLQAAPPHPGVLEVYQAELVKAPYFYSMPLLADDVNGEWRGRTLATIMGALPLEETWGIIESMANALGHAHRHGFSNCNLKPSNVLLTGDPGNPVKVSDFAQGWIGGIHEIEIEDELFYAPLSRSSTPSDSMATRRGVGTSTASASLPFGF